MMPKPAYRFTTHKTTHGLELSIRPYFQVTGDIRFTGEVKLHEATLFNVIDKPSKEAVREAIRQKLQILSDAFDDLALSMRDMVD